MRLLHGSCGIGIGCALQPLRRYITRISAGVLSLLLVGRGCAMTRSQGRLCAYPSPGETMDPHDRDRAECDLRER